MTKGCRQLLPTETPYGTTNFEELEIAKAILALSMALMKSLRVVKIVHSDLAHWKTYQEWGLMAHVRTGE